jgi:hypothetical protein
MHSSIAATKRKKIFKKINFGLVVIMPAIILACCKDKGYNRTSDLLAQKRAFEIKLENTGDKELIKQYKKAIVWINKQLEINL